MRQRIIVCPLIEYDNRYLLCKMPSNKGVFPGQWALPGGGVEAGETIEQALLREIREELGSELELDHIEPWTFRDDIRVKTYEDGSTEEIYMIYLIFNCRAKNTKIIINDEFESYAWVMKEDLYKYDLNEATKITLKQKNLI
ncbi:nucleoside triphosphatase NudI [Photorhabdus australis]|uniref:nucleoside triphosphatase NudI n=1 Tax=Photorhabdus australis TaxID=286156 RepID=UPI00056306A1|nr:nucleoside triphosphatase NudI [Photorhabdus australis]